MISIPARSQSLLGSKTVGDMMTPDTRILADGTVIGTLKHVSGYAEFSSAPAEQEGNFFQMSLGDRYKGKEITVTSLHKSKVKKEFDTDWVLRIESNKSAFKFECGEEKIITLRFSEVTLES